MLRVGIAVVVVVGLAIGVAALREELETRHVHMPPDSRLVVNATARVRGPQDTAQPLARGLVSSCIVEANPRVEVKAFDWGRDNHFRFVAQPALDEPDRRQLLGCLEDLRVAQLLVTVNHMSTSTT